MFLKMSLHTVSSIKFARMIFIVIPSTVCPTYCFKHFMHVNKYTGTFRYNQTYDYFVSSLTITASKGVSF